MKRIRFTGLVLAAVLAMSAVAAASASAAPKFEAETYPVTVKAKSSNVQKFKVESGTSECTTATFEGKATAASEWLKVLPVYSGCSFIGKVAESAVVKMNGCQYEFHATKEVVGKPGHFEGTVDVINNGAKSCATEPITVVAATCEVKVGPQTGLGPVEYVNIGAGAKREVEVNANVQNITYTESTLCPLRKEPQPKTTGIYEGKALAAGFNELAEQEGILVK